MVTDFLRGRISKHFTGVEEVVFKNAIPSMDSLAERFKDIPELGIYLHIPSVTGFVHIVLTIRRFSRLNHAVHIKMPF